MNARIERSASGRCGNEAHVAGRVPANRRLAPSPPHAPDDARVEEAIVRRGDQENPRPPAASGAARTSRCRSTNVAELSVPQPKDRRSRRIFASTGASATRAARSMWAMSGTEKAKRSSRQVRLRVNAPPRLRPVMPTGRSSSAQQPAQQRSGVEHRLAQRLEAAHQVGRPVELAAEARRRAACGVRDKAAASGSPRRRAAAPCSSAARAPRRRFRAACSRADRAGAGDGRAAPDGCAAHTRGASRGSPWQYRRRNLGSIGTCRERNTRSSLTRPGNRQRAVTVTSGTAFGAGKSASAGRPV